MSTDIIELPEIKHHFSDGLYAKQICLPQDHFMVQHKHTYDHMSILAEGWVVVKVDGVETEYHAPACINIAAGKSHEVTAVTNSVWFCIHATDETDVEKVDQVLIRN
jgi:quercetin dioxygenase-like cupin family protein